MSPAGPGGLPGLDLRQQPDDYLEREFHPTLVAELKACGGLWYAGDAYTSAARVVEQVRDRGIRALRLDFRDLSLLHDLPDLLHLEVASDGRPLAWVSTRRHDERESARDDFFELELRVWPGPSRLAAHLDFHGNWIEWLL